MEIIHAQFIWVMYLLKEYCAVYFSTCAKKLTVNVVVDRLIHGRKLGHATFTSASVEVDASRQAGAATMLLTML